MGLAMSSMMPMTWSGPFSGTRLPLHSGMLGTAGTSSVMLSTVPGGSGRAPAGPVPLLPGRPHGHRVSPLRPDGAGGDSHGLAGACPPAPPPGPNQHLARRSGCSAS